MLSAKRKSYSLYLVLTACEFIEMFNVRHIHVKGRLIGRYMYIHVDSYVGWKGEKKEGTEGNEEIDKE